MQSQQYQNHIGNVLYKVNVYQYAVKFYHHSDHYKNSDEQALKCLYNMGLDYNEKGEYRKARTAFKEAGDYKDSDSKKVEALKEAIRISKPGTSVIKIGKYTWKVLEVEDNKALLLKNKVLPEMTFCSSVENASWEDSDLRKFLNNDFIDKAVFSPEEMKNILKTPVSNGGNSVYGVAGGNDTSDYLFLLSNEEARSYESVFKKFKGRTWLRSPGGAPGSASFLTDKGLVMDYGYAVTSDEFTAMPAMWFNLQ